VTPLRSQDAGASSRDFLLHEHHTRIGKYEVSLYVRKVLMEMLVVRYEV